MTVLYFKLEAMFVGLTLFHYLVRYGCQPQGTLALDMMRRTKELYKVYIVSKYKTTKKTPSQLEKSIQKYFLQ